MSASPSKVGSFPTSASISSTSSVIRDPKEGLRRVVESCFSEEIKSKEEAPKSGFFKKGVAFVGSWIFMKSPKACSSLFESYADAIAPIVLPLLAKAKSSGLIEAFGSTDRPALVIKNILITALDNLAKAVPVKKNEKGEIFPPTFIDIISFVIEITSREFERHQGAIAASEKKIKEIQDELLKLDKEASKDFGQIAKLIKEKDDLIKRRSEIIPLIFTPLIRCAFPNDANDLGMRMGGKTVFSLLTAPSNFVRLYEAIMMFSQPHKASSIPLFSFSWDAVTLFRAQLIEQKEEKEKSATGPTGTPTTTGSQPPQQTLTDRIVDIAKDFFIDMHPKRESDDLEDAPEFIDYQVFWKTFSSNVKVLIVDLAKSQDPHITKMWRHVAASLETVASTALQHIAGEVKESSSSAINGTSFALRNLGHVLANFYAKNRTRLNVDAATYARDREALVKDVFKPLAIELAVETDLLQALKPVIFMTDENDKIPDWVKLLIKNLPNLLYTSYGSLMSHQPHLRDWFVPEMELKAAHGEFERKVEGEEKVIIDAYGKAAMAMARTLPQFTLDSLVTECTPDRPLAQGMTTAIINIMTTHFPVFASQSGTFFNEMVQVVCSLMTYSLRDTSARGLRQFACTHLEVLFLQVFSKAKAPLPLPVPIATPTPPIVEATPAPPSASVVSPPSHWFSFLISKCTNSMEEFYKGNSEQLEKLYLTSPKKLPTDKELSDCMGPLADQLILDLHLAGIPKLEAFSLKNVLRTQILRYLYQLYCLLIQAQRGQSLTHQRTMQLIHAHETPKDETLQKLYESLGALDAQSEEKLSIEEANKEKEAKRKEISKRIEDHKRKVAAATTPHVSAVESLSQGVVGPVLRTHTQAFLTASDKAAALLNAKLGMGCSPDVLGWFDGEMKILFSDPATPIWHYVDYLLFATFQKVLVNLIQSSEHAARRVSAELDEELKESASRRDVHDSVTRRSIIVPGSPLRRTPHQTLRSPARPVAIETHRRTPSALPAPPQHFQWDSCLVNLFERISKITFRHFNKAEADKILKEEREMRLNIEKDRRRINELQAQIEKFGESERKQKTYEAELRAREPLLPAMEQVANGIHKQLVQQFYVPICELMKEFGTDFNEPSHPFYDIPLPEKLKKEIWEQIPGFVADLIAQYYYQIYQENPQDAKDTLLSIFRSDHAAGLSRIIGIMVQDLTPDLTRSNASEVARNIFECAERFVASAEDHPAKKLLLGAITPHREVIARTLIANIEAIAGRGIHEELVDSRPAYMQHALKHIGELTDSSLLKILQKLSIRLRDLDEYAPNLMEDFIPTSALRVIAQHIDNASRGVRNLRLRHLRDVSPALLDRLKTEYGVGHLHPALRPIVLTPEETAGRTAQNIAQLRREREEKQRFDHLYRPLTDRLLRLANLRSKDVMGGELGLKILAESLGPKILATVYDKLCSQSLFDTITKNLSDKMKGLCEGILAQQHSPDYGDRNAHTPTAEEIEAEAKEKATDEEWRDLFTEITNGLPGFLSTIMSIPDSSGTALKDIPVPNIRRATKAFFREWPLTRLINEMAFKPTLESMNPKGLRPTGQFNEENPKTFHSTPMARQLQQQQDLHNNRIKAQESLLAAKKVVLLGIRGNLARIPNAIFDPMERAATWVARNIFCCCANPVERVLRELIKFIRTLVQFICYPLTRIFDYFLERYVSWQVPLAFQNIRHPINENLAILLTFHFLDTAIERLDAIERQRIELRDRPTIRTSLEDRRTPMPSRSRPPDEA